MTKNQRDEFRPPLFSASTATAYGFGAKWCYEMSQAGSDIGTLGALLASGMALKEVIRAIDDHSKLRIYRKRQKQFKRSAKDHGQAEFETFRNIKAAGLLSRHGVFLGTTSHRKKRFKVKYDFENSGILLGPPGTGKSSQVIIPTAITDPHSLVINDNSCEILAVTRKRRQLLGNRTVVITAAPSRVKAIVGPDVEIAYVNVYSDLNFTGPAGKLIADVKGKSLLWIPKRNDEDDKSRFFRADAREILDFITLYLAKKNAVVALPNIRRVLMSGPEEMAEMFSESMSGSDFGGVLAEIANGLLMVKMDSPEQFAGGYGVAKQAIGWADHVSEVGEVLSRSTFKPSDLKGDQAVTAYVCMPGELGETYQTFSNAMFSYIWRGVCRDTRPNTVTCLIDECATLGYLPLFEALEQGRKHKLRLFLAFQEVAGQAEHIYGKAGFKRIMAAADVVWASNIREPESLELLSKLVGTRAGRNTSLNDRAGFAGIQPDQTYATGHTSLPLLRPEEIRTLPAHQALVLFRNLQPLLLEKQAYYLDSKLKKWAAPNPYYKG